MLLTKRLSGLFVYLMTITLLAVPLSSQSTSTTRPKEITIENSQLVEHGELLSKGTNEVPTGKFKVKSYRLERIKLTHTLTIGTGGERHFDYLLRLVVTGERFSDSTFTIWADDQPFTAKPSLDLREVRADFLNGPNFLEDGASLSVSKGMPCGYAPGSETVLPEKFEVPPEFRAVPTESLPIHLRTIPHSRVYNGKPTVAITVTTKENVINTRNAMQTMQIGKRSFPAGGVFHELSAEVLTDDFLQIPENSQIFLGWDLCPMGGGPVGRLHKGDLDQ